MPTTFHVRSLHHLLIRLSEAAKQYILQPGCFATETVTFSRCSTVLAPDL